MLGTGGFSCVEAFRRMNKDFGTEYVQPHEEFVPDKEELLAAL